MKAITVYQPWASLLVMGEKHFETRSWKTGHRGPLVVHAGRKFTEDMRNLCMMEPFYSALKRGGINKPAELPLGSIVGVVNLEDCLPSEVLEVQGQEEQFGDFRPGRWAWKATGPKALKEAIKFQGKLGLFDLPEPFPEGWEQLAELLGTK